MLTIRNDQLSAFHEAAVVQYAAEVAQALAAEFSAYADARAFDAADFMQLSTEGIARGRQFGLVERGHLLAFVKIGAVLSLRFYDLPTIKMIMGDPILTAAEKVQFLIETTQSLLARQADGGGDEAAD